MLVGEVWLPDAERFARYLRPDELHTAFNFDFLACPWEPGADARLDRRRRSPRTRPVDAPATWVLSNHDVTRPVTRYGRADTSFAFESKRAGTPTDLALGTRRARAAALLAMALPGSMYIYQGEELGLPEVEDIPAERRQDPMWHPLRRRRSRPRRLPRPDALGGRPAAVRLQRATGADRPWLDQPDDWAPLTVAAQSRDRDSMLALYRAGLRLRRADAVGGRRRPALAPVAPTPSSRSRAASASSASSTSARSRSRCRPAPSVLIASNELEGGALPQDTTVWLRQANGSGSVRDTSTRDRQDSQRSIGRTVLTKGSDDEVHPYGHDRRRHRGEPAGRVRQLDLERVRERSSAKHGHDQRRVADPGQHAGGDAAVQQPGHGVREGQSRRSRSSRSSTSGPARRSRPSSPPARCRPCSPCRSPTPARSATTASSPT